MPKQPSDDSILVSAARAVGATLGRVKRLTDAAQRSSPRRRASGSGQTERGQTSARPATRRSTGPQASRQASPAGQSTRKRAVPILEHPDMEAAQAGASRSPRQTESSRRGKSRSKRSKSRRASRRT